MKYSIVAAFGALAASASAQTMTMDVKPGPSPSPAAGGGNITNVMVGGVDANGQPTSGFTPSVVTASMGDTVRFTFMQGNNSVMQTSLDAPCAAVKSAVKSEVFSNPEGKVDGAPSFDFVIKSTSTTFFTSSDAAACMAGNVLAINPSGSSNVMSYMQKAMAMNKALAPAGGIVAQAAPAQAAAGQTLMFQVAGAAAATGAAGANGGANVVSGSGTGGGQTCNCQCLCGMTAFPSNVGQGMFGGFLGEMPTAPTTAGAAGAASAPAPAAAMMPPPMKRAAMPPLKRGKMFV